MEAPQSHASGGQKRRGKRGWQHRLGAQQKPFKQQQQQHPGYRGPPPTNLGYFGTVGAVPSLEDLRAANKQQTRRHFSGPRHKPRRQRNTPKSIPRAPEHHHASLFPSGANPLDTPAPEIASVPTAADKLEAEGLNSGLDFYGTNEGMLSMFRGRGADSASEQSELEGPSGDDDDYAAALAGGGIERPTSLNARLAEQEAYIATLEDENLRLRERLDMVQQELNELRQGRGGEQEQADSGSVLSHSSEDHSVAHVAGAAEGPAESPS